jgi:hypothetical protein
MSFDLVQDIENCPAIMAKIRAANNRYAQNLYAAWCNMQWTKHTAWSDKAGLLAPLDSDNYWTASWRAAGGIVARLRDQGEDYMDYYCSGMRGGLSFDGKEDDQYFERTGYVSESVVTEEIASDLESLGWYPVPYKDEDLV